MERDRLPDYALFDDHRYSQRIAVVVRWFLIVTWLFLHNYRPDINELSFIINNALAIGLGAVNGYVHWRIWKGRPITRRYVLALSVLDLAAITTGIGVTSRFDNTFFVLYYPALLGLALVFTSRRLSFTVVVLVAVAYAALSISMNPGVSYSDKEERTLVVRIASMFAVIAAGNLMTRIERNRRREAVEAERLQSERNLELQRRAQEAELAAQAERDRIARDIHDGVAQSMYALSLNLETCADLAAREQSPLHDQLQRLVPLAKNTLLETRHYIHDLKPLLAGHTDVVAAAENQIKEFQMVANTPTKLSVVGEPSEVSVGVATGLYRILQEALANVLKHARASAVNVALTFEPSQVKMSVEDDGAGFQPGDVRSGYGLENMRRRTTDLGGGFELFSVPGKGARVSVTLPVQEAEGEVDKGDDR